MSVAVVVTPGTPLLEDLPGQVPVTTGIRANEPVPKAAVLT